MISARFQTLVLFTLLCTGAAAGANEFDTLRLRWRDMLTEGTNASLSDGLYQNWINSVDSTTRSYWNSLNTNSSRTYLWSSYPNLATDSSDITGSFTRLRAMALGYSVRDASNYNNSSLRAAIISALDWLYTNYYNPTGVVYDNWFDFEIGAPLALNDIVVLLYSNLSPAQISNYMASVEHFAPSPYYSVISSNLTAANKVWKCVVVGVRGAVVQDSNKIDLVKWALSDVFPYVTANDGFYADGSFIFHGYFPYNSGYGVELLDSMGQLMQWMGGSTWQITDPAQTNVFRWVYDSYEPFIVRGAAMEIVDGRYHTRNGDSHQRGADMLGAILRLAQVAPAQDALAYKSFVKGAIQADTFRNFVAAQPPPYNVWANAVLNDTGIPALGETAGHRQFPGLDRIVHRNANWTFALAMSSGRVANYESTRGENLKGWFTADGMTYLYNSDLGQYADNFWSTVDPYRMPGTTIDTVVRTNGSGDSYRSPNNQVGGASILGTYGVAAMHLNAYGTATVSARKSWFMFDNEIVCVGNSITSGVSSTVETIIENRRLGIYGNNAFTVNGTAKSSGPGWAETMTAPSWAHLAGSTPGADIGYFFPQSTTVKALRESRSGAFKDINTTYGSTMKSTRHYLTMYVDHGTNPSSGTYSYVLLPGMSASEVAAYAANPDVTVVQNNSTATAVRENKLGITAVNFWRDSSNYVGGVSADRKAAVILRNDGSLLDIGVSDPTQTNSSGFNVEVSTPATAILSVDAGISVLQISPTIKLAIDSSNKFGASLRAQFALTAIQTNTLTPVADAYVQNGAQAPLNFGAASTLQVKVSGTAGQTREAYLRFDLSSVRGDIVGAVLHLGAVTTNDALYHALSPVPDSSWGESTITWSNKPEGGAEFTRWIVPAVGAAVDVSVTALAQQAAGADGKLSLRLYSTGTPTPTNGGFTAYASKENGTNRPQLTVFSLRIPPTVNLSCLSPSPLDAPAVVTLSAQAQDLDGVIATVDLYNGNTRIMSSLLPPYGATLTNLGARTYTFTAVATDNSGLSATSAPVAVAVYLPEPAGRGSGLDGEYYSDRNLTTLVTARTDTNVNFSWSGSPAAGVPPDNFSVRWIGKVQARHSGLHQFSTITDEGVRLWVNGRLVIDNWTAHPQYQVEDAGSISLVAGCYYDLVMEFFDASLTAVAQLSWTQPGVATEIVPTSQLYPAEQGLRGTYFSGTNLASAVLTRIDGGVNFSWGTNSPDPTVLTGSFSARWTGKVRANQAGTYSFFTVSDDAVRLWVNGQLLISNWAPHAQMEDSNSLTLAAGQYYDLVMEYFNGSGAATAVLMWQPPGETKQVLSAANLTPYHNNNPPSLAPIPSFVCARNGLVTFTAGATDPDVPSQSLLYSLDPGAPLGATVDASTGAFSWVPSNAQPFGPCNIVLRVTDNGSPQMSDAQTFTIIVLTNMAAASVTLVGSGTDWQYLDNGADQGTAWRSVGYNDAAWKIGKAALGYGIGGEATVTSFGTNVLNKFITTYFRRTFYIPDAALAQSLTARLMRDDGAVVYLNGSEVWRDNMPAGTVAFSTLASSAITGASQTQFITRALSPSALVSGTNVLAVEIHQDSPSTPDAFFDFELSASAFVPLDAALRCTASGGTSRLAWPQAGGLLNLYSTTNLTPPVLWLPVGTHPGLSNGEWSVMLPSPTNAKQFFRLQTP